MKKILRLALLAAAFSAGTAPLAADGPPGAPASASVKPVPDGSAFVSIAALAAAIRADQGSLDASLGSLGGGPLTLALLKAARAGRPLRILLDPEDQDSREQGRRLSGITPTAQVRWGAPFRNRRRWMDLGGSRQVVWYAGGALRALSSTAMQARFERAWSAADLRPSAETERALDDQLNALPDPRDLAPHFVRRAFGAAH